MDEVEIFLRLALMGFSLLLLVTSSLACAKLKELKIFFATLAFALFFVEGLILGIGIFIDSFEEIMDLKLLVSFNFGIIIFLYLSIVKK